MNGSIWIPLIVGILAGAAAAILVFWAGYKGQQRRDRRSRWMPHVLRTHFRTEEPETLLVTERRFPFHMRSELATAIDGVFADGEHRLDRCLGVKKDHPYVESSFSDLIDFETRLFAVAPQFEEINIGESVPLRAVRNGVWLGQRGPSRFAIVSTQDHTACGGQLVRLQVATANDGAGAQLANHLFQRCEESIAQGRSYRGKVLSFEPGESYTGESTGIFVHALSPVDREQVILPERTLQLLERNVIDFARHRVELARRGQATKKGLLFYGPPGTGKTHTIQYLARAVPGQTVFLITAEQIKHLSDYMTLARLLQPSLVVIEDVDLIARNRADHTDPTSEVLLNKLLNEMDGLRGDSMIICILTSNRPEALEAALAARPGRIDQAIEFPLPDDVGRRRLVQLYTCGIPIDDQASDWLVARTEGVSAAFIKEAVRRAVQFHVGRNGNGRLDGSDIEPAIEEMLVSGGDLNRLLLGAGQGRK